MSRGDWESDWDDLNEALWGPRRSEKPRKRRPSDVAGSHALIDSHFDDEDGWKDDIEDMVPTRRM